MDDPCEYFKKKLIKCLDLNYEVFGKERGKVMCDHIQKILDNNCNENK